MNLVSDQLVALTGALKPVAGTTAADLAEMRQFVAAALIQQNPNVVVAPDPSLDPAIQTALNSGAALAAQFKLAGTLARFVQENELSPNTPESERPARVFGPFADEVGHLSKFQIFENAKFLALHVVFPVNPSPEVQLMVPQASILRPDKRTIDIPAGTVWILTRFLVNGATGRVGVRVSCGTLAFTDTAVVDGLSRILILETTSWTLTVQPEQPPAGDAAGSDANSATVSVPQTLLVHSSGAPSVTGAIGISGFGSTLVFDQPGAARVARDISIEFPFGPASLPWTIAGNRSAVAQLRADCNATGAAWSLAMNLLAPAALGEAANAGSFEADLSGSISVVPAGLTSGALKLPKAHLSADGVTLSVSGETPAGSGRVELDLWTPATSRVVFGAEPITRLLFLSERQDSDLVVVDEGGSIRNRWDLPLKATGAPFGFEGPLESLALIARAGALFVALTADQFIDNVSEGLALENFYLTVRPLSRVVLLGTYDGTASVADGRAILFFDVLLGQPMLPDPYAANWSVPDGLQVQRSAFTSTLTWQQSATPTIASQLRQPLFFPEGNTPLTDEDAPLRQLFDSHVGSHHESLSMLDLSTNEDLYGVALESLSSLQPTIQDNQLALRLSSMRVLMQPQVLWEPVLAGSVSLESASNGARTLAGTRSVKLAPVLPGNVLREWVLSAQRLEQCGAMFSLPFGLRAFAQLNGPLVVPISTSASASLESIAFGPDVTSALQVRLTAPNFAPAGTPPNPARTMDGSMRQLKNLKVNSLGFGSVVDDPAINVQLGQLSGVLALHQADLSGYGLSAFSDWHQDVPVGITQVRFDVMIGRTSFEVIQAKTILAPCEATLVRSIFMERRNSGKMLRFDTGWVAVDDGLFASPAKFDKGVVIAYRNIRRVRVPGKTLIKLSNNSLWEEVIYDADAELENLTGGGIGGRLPIYDQTGYIKVTPTAPTAEEIALLFAAVNGTAGGAADGAIRVGGTLDMQLSGIFAGVAPKKDSPPGFVVAAYGSPKLPRAGQWSAVSVSSGGEAATVDPRHGIPVIRLSGAPYTFRDPDDANRNPPVKEYGLLMSTPTSRVLFSTPSINPGEGALRTAPPAFADPLAIAQATGVFPRGAFAMQGAVAAAFNISGQNEWQLTGTAFDLKAPIPDLAKGGEWTIQRLFPAPPKLTSLIDSAIENKPWDLALTPSKIDVNIDPFGSLFVIETNYDAVSGALGKLKKPSLDFGDKLKDVKDLVNALTQFTGMGVDFNVDVSAGSGPSPSFVVTLDLNFLLGEGPNERFDIGIGKFYGEFHVHGQLEAALSDSISGSLLAEFQGDVQQGIIPPLVYAGGFFRFAIQIDTKGHPTVELGLGMTTSLGGDLIKDLVEVEVTITYGYTLVPQDLQPGVLLRLEARAKLLAGLIGFSFSLQAMARIIRADLENIRIFADIRVVASVTVAWLIDEDVDMRTQFEQNIPLRLAALPLGGGAVALTAAI